MTRKGVSCDFCNVLIRPEDFESGEAVVLLKRRYCPRCMAAAVKRSRQKRSAAASTAVQTPPTAPRTPVGGGPSRRRHERKDCSIAVELSVVLTSGRLYDRGRAVLWNISLSGALLRAILLPAKALPSEPHQIGIRVLEGALAGFHIVARPVRLVHTEDGLHMAVEFVRMADAQLKELRKLI